MATIILSADISGAFIDPSDDDSIYWIAGVFVVWAIFGLISAYMIFNKVKNNITRRSKINMLFFMPLLPIATIGGGIYMILENVPTQRGPYLSWMGDPKTSITITFESQSVDDYEVIYKKSSESELSY